MNTLKVSNYNSNLYVFLSVVFTTCLLLSNILAAKLIAIGPWSVTAGVLLFPISYIVNDIIVEVYGFRMARKIIWIGFAMNIFMVLVFQIAIIMPSPDWFDRGGAFTTTLSSTPRLVCAGLIAYLMGSWANAAVISKLKTLSKNGSKFATRAILSTLIGESIDTSIFVPIAFLGKVSVLHLVQIIMIQVILKTSYECVILPLTIILVKKIKAYENLNTFDDGITYWLLEFKKYKTNIDSSLKETKCQSLK